MGKEQGMTPEDLEHVKDDDTLRAIIGRAQTLLTDRAKQREKDAIAEARAALAKAGLTFKDVEGIDRKGAKKTAGLKAGQKIVHPDDPKKVYTAGKGRRPDWVNALEKEGRLPAAS
jgi:hypothetical protein